MRKIAVISDVHGNVPALNAVLEDATNWGADEFVANGDIINNGPLPGACLDILLEHSQSYQWTFLKGNHEDYVLNSYQKSFEHLSQFEKDYFYISYWTLKHLSPNHIHHIQNWKDYYIFETFYQKKIIFTHASLKSREDGFAPQQSTQEMLEKLKCNCDILVTGHTHMPFIRKVNQTTIINGGSVGSCVDNDLRASYAQICICENNIDAQIKRVLYDRQKHIKNFETTGFLQDCAPLSQILYRSAHDGKSRMGNWRRMYLQKVMKHEIDFSDSVAQYLATH